MLVLLLVLMPHLVAPADARDQEAVAAPALPGKSQSPGGTRTAVFPQEFSLGKLFVCVLPAGKHILPNSKVISKTNESFIAEARGKVKLPTKGYVYLIPTYQLLEHPQVLRKLDPNIVDCVGLARVGVLESLDNLIEPLSHLTGLRRLDLELAELPDDLLKNLKTLTKLEALDLASCSVRGSFLKDLSALTNLEELDLSNNRLEPTAFAAISQFHNLQELNLSYTGCTDANVSDLIKLKNLRELFLVSTKITAKGLCQLQTLKNLNYLDLTDIDLHAKDLCCLSSLKLKTLRLPRRYSFEQMRMLETAMPATHLKVYRESIDKDTNKLLAPLK